MTFFPGLHPWKYRTCPQKNIGKLSFCRAFHMYRVMWQLTNQILGNVNFVAAPVYGIHIIAWQPAKLGNGGNASVVQCCLSSCAGTPTAPEMIAVKRLYLRTVKMWGLLHDGQCLLAPHLHDTTSCQVFNTLYICRLNKLQSFIQQSSPLGIY